MGSNSQAPQVFDQPEKYDYQSLHHQADPPGVYNDWTFCPDPDRSDSLYTVHGVVQEESVSTDPLALVSQQHDPSSSFDPFTSSTTSDYPAQHQEFDSSTITASFETVGSSTSYRMRDSESELSSWSVDNPSFSRPGWDDSIPGQRDSPALGSTYEQDDWPVSPDIFLPESFERQGKNRISLPFIQSLTCEDPHVGSGTQRRNEVTDSILMRTSDWRLDHRNKRMNNTYGVHSSVLDPRAVEDFDRFQASVDATRHGGGIEQGELFLCPEEQYFQVLPQVGNLGDQLFDDLANPTSSELYAPPMEGSAVASTIILPRGNRLQAQPTRGRPGSGPVMDFCEKCGAKFTGDNSRNTKKKHMREKHSPFHHKCQLVSTDGSPCPKIIKCPTNRRRHVEDFHKSEAKLLPMENPKRNPVPRLDGWFEKVPKSDE